MSLEPHIQGGILAPIPPHARYLTARWIFGTDPRPVLRALARLTDGTQTVLGLGESLLNAQGWSVPGHRSFRGIEGSKVRLPATPADLWIWLRDTERGQLLERSRQIEALIAPAFETIDLTEAFKHGDGRDLTGYEDGTENPEGTAALEAAFLPEGSGPLAGSSFLAVQRWRHRLDRFDAMSKEQQDNAVGRERETNEELDDAPESAHVKRTAQESFQPEAFVLRRSMPWTGGQDCGLVFTAFGHAYDAFEAQLRRMCGAEDGIVDALFGFSEPETGAYFWCPPVRNGALNLEILGL